MPVHDPTSAGISFGVAIGLIITLSWHVGFGASPGPHGSSPIPLVYLPILTVRFEKLARNSPEITGFFEILTKNFVAPGLHLQFLADFFEVHGGFLEILEEFCLVPEENRQIPGEFFEFYDKKLEFLGASPPLSE